MAIKDSIQRGLVIGVTTLSLLGIAGTGGVLVTQGAFAQSSPAPTATPNASGGTGTSAPTSNEDPTHEAAERAANEAAEDSGQFHGGRDGKHGSNENPAHEAKESAEREAAEDAASSGGSTTPTVPATTAPSSTIQ